MKIRKASNDVRTFFSLVYFLTFSDKDNFSNRKFSRIVRVFPSIITNWSVQFNSQKFLKNIFLRKPILFVNFLDTTVTFGHCWLKIRKASYYLPTFAYFIWWIVSFNEDNCSTMTFCRIQLRMSLRLQKLQTKFVYKIFRQIIKISRKFRESFVATVAWGGLSRIPVLGQLLRDRQEDVVHVQGRLQETDNRK